MKRSDPPSTIAKCSKCAIPLDGKQQFIGHWILSHEVGLEYAEKQWGIWAKDYAVA
jgi:hypothetical protein